MKPTPRARALRRAHPGRASTRIRDLAGFGRSLCASTLLHLLLVLLLAPAERSTGLRRGGSHVVRFASAATFAGAPGGGARGHAGHGGPGGAPAAEPWADVTSEAFELAALDALTVVEAPAEPETYDEEEDVPLPAFELADLLGRVSARERFVLPEAVEARELDHPVAAVDRRATEPVDDAAPTPPAEQPPTPPEQPAEPVDAEGGADETAASVVLGAPPAYPELAIRMGWEGVVVCEIDVAPNGSVLAVRVKESSGYELLDEVAVEAIRAWRFQPGVRAGVKVADTIEHRIRFELEGA